jgi:hypothetical protein
MQDARKRAPCDLGSLGTFTGTQTPTTTDIAEVPGSGDGVGLPGLLAAFGCFLAWRRKRNTEVTV